MIGAGHKSPDKTWLNPVISRPNYTQFEVKARETWVHENFKPNATIPLFTVKIIQYGGILLGFFTKAVRK